MLILAPGEVKILVSRGSAYKIEAKNGRILEKTTDVLLQKIIIEFRF